ncbi:hypothetical protein LJC37_01725 [Bacteroidales bacterium OttesenSCG-928-E04]|nr:hypothetical protein [Bacteroidales bacterium OttesenSCG-928-E04]
MATKKIQMQHKTANGFDVVHPETSADQVLAGSKKILEHIGENYVDKERNLESAVDGDGLDGIIAYMVEEGSGVTKAKVVDAPDFYRMFTDLDGYLGHFERMADADSALVDSPVLSGWDGSFNIFCTYGFDSTFGLAVIDVNDVENPKFREAFNASGGGIKIAVSQTDPGNLEAGDFWYKELV